MTDSLTRPRLYLDVDGAINAQIADHNWGPRSSGVAQGFRIVWAPGMIDALAGLDVDLVWLTTWRELAVSDIAPLIGWGAGQRGESVRVLHPLSGKTTYPSIDWKREALAADQSADPSPFIWLDDESEHGDRRMAKEMDGLALTPNPYFGVTCKQMEVIRAYLAACREVEEASPLA